MGREQIIGKNRDDLKCLDPFIRFLKSLPLNCVGINVSDCSFGYIFDLELRCRGLRLHKLADELSLVRMRRSERYWDNVDKKSEKSETIVEFNRNDNVFSIENEKKKKQVG